MNTDQFMKRVNELLAEIPKTADGKNKFQDNQAAARELGSLFDSNREFKADVLSNTNISKYSFYNLIKQSQITEPDQEKKVKINEKKERTIKEPDIEPAELPGTASPEPEPTKRIAIDLPDHQHRQLNVLAAAKGKPLSIYCKEILLNDIKKNKEILSILDKF